MKFWTMLPIPALLLLAAVAHGGEIATQFEKQQHAATQPSPATQPAAGADKDAITEIGIERTECFGTCPAYTFIISANGKIRLHGEAYVGDCIFSGSP